MKASQKTFGLEPRSIAQVVIPACVAGLTALAIACPASAADPSDGAKIVHERVIYRDLDLSTAQGAHTLVRRVEAAAQNLCSPSGPRLTGGPSAEEFRCRDQATARAVAQLGSPMVIAEYAKQTGRAPSHEVQPVVANTR